LCRRITFRIDADEHNTGRFKASSLQFGVYVGESLQRNRADIRAIGKAEEQEIEVPLQIRGGEIESALVGQLYGRKRERLREYRSDGRRRNTLPSTRDPNGRTGY